MMGFPLAHIPLPCGKKLSDFIFVFQIRGILHSPFINISGKHSEIGIHKTDNPKCIKKPYSNQGQGKTYQNQNHKKTVELVVPISPLHKPVKFFSHSARAFLCYSSRLQKSSAKCRGSVFYPTSFFAINQ